MVPKKTECQRFPKIHNMKHQNIKYTRLPFILLIVQTKLHPYKSVNFYVKIFPSQSIQHNQMHIVSQNQPKNNSLPDKSVPGINSFQVNFTI